MKGPNDFRNPSEDLPSDWSDEQCRTLHYQALGKPLDAQAFVRLLRTRMEAALTNFNRVLPDLNHLRIFRPRQNDDRGLWALAKLERQPEPQSLGVIKEKIGSRSDFRRSSEICHRMRGRQCNRRNLPIPARRWLFAIKPTKSSI